MEREKTNKMEIEYKYFVDEDISKEIFADYQQAGGDNQIKEIFMDATYYDTEEGNLWKKGMALRKRKENDQEVVTLKDRGYFEEGVHKRMEINVKLEGDKNSEESIISSELFVGTQIYEDIKDILRSSLKPLMTMTFTREEMKISLGDTTMIMSYDKGLIKTPMGNKPISELELELGEGSQDKMREFSNQLKERYNLEYEEKSKFARGLELYF